MSLDQNLYTNRFGHEEMGGRVELWQVLCEWWLPQYFPAHSSILDLGAGYCEFINNIPATKKIAIDRSTDVREYAAKDVTAIIADLIDGLRQLEDNSVDRVMASNVFEHLPNREVLFQCLREAWRVLEPGGKIVVMQPNIAAVKEKFYDFVDHSLPLTEKGMGEALRVCGFVIERLTPRFLPYTTKSRYPRWPFLVRLYLRFPFMHRFMGGQMFVVARKPDQASASG